MSNPTLREALETITNLAKHVDFDRLPLKLRWDIENAEAVRDDDFQQIYLTVPTHGDPSPFWNEVECNNLAYKTIWEDEILKPCAETIQDRINEMKCTVSAVNEIKKQMETMGVTLEDLK